MQLNAARIVTRLPVFCSLRSLYLETGWETLAERRKTTKLILMYKIIKTETPRHLNDLLSSLVNDASNYNLRNNTNYDLPFCRLCSYKRLISLPPRNYGMTSSSKLIISTFYYNSNHISAICHPE